MVNNLKPKKSLGQHFLHSPSALRKIIEAAKIAPTKSGEVGETILEIGPGTGILTRELLATGAHVVAIEKDNRAFDMLSQDFFKDIAAKRLELVLGDILEADISNILAESKNDDPKGYALVANIPYYITGAILEKFLEHEPRPNRMVLLVQKEVADRIVAKPTGNGRGSPAKESVLSISVKAFGTPRIVADVPRGAFVPPPTVDSAILAIENIKAPENLDIPRFFSIVKAGFAHKRKFAVRNLEAVLAPEEITKIWQKLNLSEKIRAEDITPEQWIEITN